MAPVASTVRGSSGFGGVDVGRRRRRSGATTNRGDGGGVGREIWGASGGRGGNGFLVKSKLAVARFAERAIAKVAIALFPKHATAIHM